MFFTEDDRSSLEGTIHFIEKVQLISRPSYLLRLVEYNLLFLQSVTSSAGVGEEPKKEDAKTILSVVRPHRISRTVSMCETISSHPNPLRLGGPTCSWPRGILKHRSRSLSESYLGDDISALSLGSTSSSIDMESKLDGEDEEGISSSFGEKKSVRFNEVVSRQLFRSNKAILFRRMKNQKKALKKRRKRQNQDNAANSEASDTNTASEGFTTTTTDEDTDATTTDATESEDVDVDLTVDDVEEDNFSNNNNTTSTGNVSVMNENYHESIRVTDNESNNNSSETWDTKNEEDSDTGFIVKTSRKKKRNKKNKANFEPSNNLIFQLDLDK